MKKYVPLALLMGVSLSAAAAEPEPALKMTMSLGLQTRNVSVSDTAAPYKDNSTSGTAALSVQLNAVTSLALSMSYTLDQAKSDNDKTQGTMRAKSVAASVSRYIGSGRVISGSLSYGRTALESLATGVTYSTDADALAAGVGITQYIPLSPTLNSSIGLSYARVLNNVDRYTNSAGTRTDGQTISSDAISLSGGLQWTLGPWTPSLSVSLSRPSSALSLTNTDQAPLNFSAGLGYALGKNRQLNASYSTTAGQSNLREGTLGLNLSFPF